MLPTFLTLQERVRQFNLGTPTPMHVGTHVLVNDLWKANADMLAALQEIEKPCFLSAEQAADKFQAIARAAIARAAIAAVGDRDHAPKNSEPA